jgi:hypothetical protein
MKSAVLALEKESGLLMDEGGGPTFLSLREAVLDITASTGLPDWDKAFSLLPSLPLFREMDFPLVVAAFLKTAFVCTVALAPTDATMITSILCCIRRFMAECQAVIHADLSLNDQKRDHSSLPSIVVPGRTGCIPLPFPSDWLETPYERQTRATIDRAERGFRNVLAVNEVDASGTYGGFFPIDGLVLENPLYIERDDNTSDTCDESDHSDSSASSASERRRSAKKNLRNVSGQLTLRAALCDDASHSVFVRSCTSLQLTLGQTTADMRSSNQDRYESVDIQLPVAELATDARPPQELEETSRNISPAGICPTRLCFMPRAALYARRLRSLADMGILQMDSSNGNIGHDPNKPLVLCLSLGKGRENGGAPVKIPVRLLRRPSSPAPSLAESTGFGSFYSARDENPRNAFTPATTAECSSSHPIPFSTDDCLFFFGKRSLPDARGSFSIAPKESSDSRTMSWGLTGLTMPSMFHSFTHSGASQLRDTKSGAGSTLPSSSAGLSATCSPDIRRAVSSMLHAFLAFVSRRLEPGIKRTPPSFLTDLIGEGIKARTEKKEEAGGSPASSTSSSLASSFLRMERSTKKKSVLAKAERHLPQCELDGFTKRLIATQTVPVVQERFDDGAASSASNTPGSASAPSERRFPSRCLFKISGFRGEVWGSRVYPPLQHANHVCNAAEDGVFVASFTDRGQLCVVVLRHISSLSGITSEPLADADWRLVSKLKINVHEGPSLLREAYKNAGRDLPAKPFETAASVSSNTVTADEGSLGRSEGSTRETSGGHFTPRTVSTETDPPPDRPARRLTARKARERESVYLSHRSGSASHVVLDMAWSPACSVKILATVGSSNPCAWLWSGVDGALLAVLLTPSDFRLQTQQPIAGGGLNTVVWLSPTTLVCGGTDGGLWVWNIEDIIAAESSRMKSVGNGHQNASKNFHPLPLPSTVLITKYRQFEETGPVRSMTFISRSMPGPIPDGSTGTLTVAVAVKHKATSQRDLDSNPPRKRLGDTSSVLVFAVKCKNDKDRKEGDTIPKCQVNTKHLDLVGEQLLDLSYRCVPGAATDPQNNVAQLQTRWAVTLPHSDHILCGIVSKLAIAPVLRAPYWPQNDVVENKSRATRRIIGWHSTLEPLDPSRLFVPQQEVRMFGLQQFPKSSKRRASVDGGASMGPGPTSTLQRQRNMLAAPSGYWHSPEPSVLAMGGDTSDTDFIPRSVDKTAINNNWFDPAFALPLSALAPTKKKITKIPKQSLDTGCCAHNANTFGATRLVLCRPSTSWKQTHGRDVPHRYHWYRILAYADATSCVAVRGISGTQTASGAGTGTAEEGHAQESVIGLGTTTGSVILQAHGSVSSSSDSDEAFVILGGHADAINDMNWSGALAARGSSFDSCRFFVTSSDDGSVNIWV